MAKITINARDYWNKVYGCWMGKNIGGTLGAPVEGQLKIHEFDFYPEIREGGIPNDDLEMQIIWLECLEKYGPGMTSRELCEFWLNHIFYNFDEYGYAKTNLRKGLLPPTSGWFNNWHRESMGCPIRSEIWACVAPGAPHIAARLAFQDGIVDHAYESVWAEMFYAAIESAAFVCSDRDALIETGLACIPADCRTARAVRDTIKWFEETADWKAVRQRIIEAYANWNCTFSTPNIAFTILGWISGEGDFGRSLCNAVNCGYDTDCTGATLGSILGIILGKDGLPERWIEPIGDRIVMNEWGIKNIVPPQTLAEFTDRTVAQGPRVLSYHGAHVVIDDERPSTPVRDCSALAVPGALSDLWAYTPWQNRYDLRGCELTVDYRGIPSVRKGEPKMVRLEIRNTNPEPIEGLAFLAGPEGWEIKSASEAAFSIDPGDKAQFDYSLSLADEGCLEVSNVFYAAVDIKDRPVPQPVAFALIGEAKWLIAGPFSAESGNPMDQEWEPERLDPREWSSDWTKEACFAENRLLIEPFFAEQGPSVIYAAHWVHCPDEREVHVWLNSGKPVKAWLNGEVLPQVAGHGTIRDNPEYFGGVFAAILKQGWNRFVLKILGDPDPRETHFMITDRPLARGYADLLNTRFPWE